ncbi:TonB-dependent receptor [Gemmatimonadota bacterium DH-20]|uniref:TonB-dependent receptor n=1 Tax=Gaopeijia maritima TaxID=3119007 RepID=A0ABU9E8K8_9BACT
MSGGLLRWVALALITLGAAPVGASAQVILGRVLDDESGLGVPDVEVMLLDDRAQPVGERRLSGANGGFVFSVDPGHYQFSAFRIGYGPGTSPFVEVQRGDSVEVEFRIAQEAIVLDPLTVTASARPWYEHMKPPALWEYYERSEHMTSLGLGRFLDRDDLRPLQGMPVSIAIGNVPGMQAVAAGTGARFQVLGRLDCPALFFLNGQQVRIGSDWFIDDFVSMAEVEAIEVYTGASELPGEFHGMSGGGNCGAVVVWTKRTIDSYGR